MVYFKTMLTDEKIVKQVLAGQQDKFALLIERFESKLLRYAFFILKDEDNAADVTQEAFIKAYINLNSFNTNKSFSAWIYRIVHNEAINFINKNKKSVAFSEIDKSADNFSLDYKIGENIDKMLLKKEVRLCLSMIDLKYREPILLYYFEHLSYEQISDVLRLPVSTVGVRINRAKKQLVEICRQKGVKT